jgi:DNA gyrase subunit A
VTEIPFMVNKSRLIEQIAQLVRDKKLTDIRDMRDESDRDGMRIVIELKRDSVPEIVLNRLYKHTQMQSTFGTILLALVDGEPKVMSLREMLLHFVTHRLVVIVRRSEFDLAKAQEREHILEGLKIAVDNIDEVIRIIRGSADTGDARANLIENFDLSEIQANAILDMPLRRLTALEVDKLRNELAELQDTIADLEAILADPQRRWTIIKDELGSIRETYAEDRRSRIVPDEGDLSLEDLIADDELIITVSATGYVKSVPASTYRTQGRGGRGVKAAEVKDDDVVRHLVHTTAHAYLLFFTNRGLVHRVKAHEIPRQSRTSKGVMAQSVLPVGPDERIQAIVDTRDYETGRYLVMVTKKGQAKKTEFKEYESRNQTLVAIRLAADDELVTVRTSNGSNEILIFSEQGMGIRFAESDLRSMGRGTQGVRGMKLREDDSVVAAVSNIEGEEVLLLTSAGYGKRTEMGHFRKQTRGGIGVKAFKLTKVRGNLVAALAIKKDDEVFLISSAGVGTRQAVSKISRQQRDSTGVKVIDVGSGNRLSAVAKISEELED